MRHYDRHIGDLAAATRGLDLLHRGAYDALLDAYYLNERPLPLEAAECYALAGAMKPAEKRAVDTILARFFDRQDDGYHQARCDRELAKWSAKSGGASSAAKLRWERERQAAKAKHGAADDAERNAVAHADAMRTHSESTCDGNANAYANAMPPSTQYPVPIEPSTHCSPVSSLRSETSGNAPTGSGGAKTRRPAARGDGGREAKSTPVWQAYCDAYFARYGVEPVRNAKANSLLAQLVDRLGPDAPHVAAWYVRSSRGLYVASKHAPDLLLRDAEGLRTEWATGNGVTDTQARQADRTAATGNVFNALRSEVRDGTTG